VGLVFPGVRIKLGIYKQLRRHPDLLDAQISWEIGGIHQVAGCDPGAGRQLKSYDFILNEKKKGPNRGLKF